METTSSVVATHLSTANDIKVWFLSMQLTEVSLCFSIMAISVMFSVALKPIFNQNPLTPT